MEQGPVVLLMLVPVGNRVKDGDGTQVVGPPTAASIYPWTTFLPTQCGGT